MPRWGVASQPCSGRQCTPGDAPSRQGMVNVWSFFGQRRRIESDGVSMEGHRMPSALYWCFGPFWWGAQGRWPPRTNCPPQPSKTALAEAFAPDTP
jgi:hypothetical protein